MNIVVMLPPSINHVEAPACDTCNRFPFFLSIDGETALSLLIGFLSFIGMLIMITYTVSFLSLSRLKATMTLSNSLTAFGLLNSETIFTGNKYFSQKHCQLLL